MIKVGEIAADGKFRVDVSPVGFGPAEERKLVKRARKGDAAAFEQLIDGTSRRIFALLNRMVDDPAIIDDLAQNVYLKAWTGLSEFRGKSLFSTWLYRIATNEALGHIRSVSRRRVWEVDGENGRIDAASKTGFDSSVVDRITVREALTRLPHAYRTAISLSYMEDLKYEEAADVMGVPLNTYKTYLHRGKMKL